MTQEQYIVQMPKCRKLGEGGKAKREGSEGRLAGGRGLYLMKEWVIRHWWVKGSGMGKEGSPLRARKEWGKVSHSGKNGGK